MKKTDKPDWNLRKIEVLWSGPEKVPEGYEAKDPQRERIGKTSDGKSFEVKWFPDRKAHKDFPGSKTGVSKIFIGGELFYSVAYPYAIAFLEQFPQATTVEIVEAK